MKRHFFNLAVVASLLIAAFLAEASSLLSPRDTGTAVVEAAVTVVPIPVSTETPEAVTSTTVDTVESQPELQEDASDFPPAEIVNDEGGTVSITGEVEYTNSFFTMGVAEPMVILEDQAGFVDRNENFLMPVESQTLGQITSDFFKSPFSYSIALPIEPKGTKRDVDNDGEEDEGVQIFAVAYWSNTFGDPYLEERDLFGGGWSTAYASTLTSSNAETNREIVGGKLLVYAEDINQGFPSGFGDDGFLFTEDDPVVTLPQGFTVVNLDTEPFAFDRSRHPVIDLIEPESSALVDFSNQSYADAFDSLVEKLSKEYAFTEYKGLDWDQIHADLRPQFEEADQEQDPTIYRRALRNLALSIPDGHVKGPPLLDEFVEKTSGGLGIAVRELDNGQTIVNYLGAGMPAEEAGIELGAEILEMEGVPIDEKISATEPHSEPYSTDHFRRLQQMRYVTRFPLGTEVVLTFRNPESNTAETVTLTAVAEPQSFSFSSLNVGRDGYELPVEYEFMPDSGYVYAAINSFSDNKLLTVQLWERLIRELNENNVSGLIIDMRQNGGGSGFLADQMAAYFFNEPLVLGNTGRYDEDLDDFYFDPRREERFYLPAEELRYDGEVVLLVGPNCASACEFFSYDMTVEDRATVVGHYPTAGLGGSIDTVRMPENELFIFTKGRAVDADGAIHIEGKGVPPTILVPVTEETLLGEGDPLLDAAIEHLDSTLLPEISEGGELQIGNVTEGQLPADTAIAYTLQVSTGDIIDIIAASNDFDPAVLIFDQQGNLLAGNEYLSEGATDAGFKNLEIPQDLSLILWVTSLDEEEGGAFTFRIADARGFRVVSP